MVTGLLDRDLVHSLEKLVVCRSHFDVSQQACAASVRCHQRLHALHSHHLPVSIRAARYLLYINGPGMKTITDFSFPKGLKYAYIWKLVWLSERLAACLALHAGLVMRNGLICADSELLSY